MKKSILSVAAAGLLLSACSTTPQFTINGTVEGENNGKIYLLQSNENKVDTLAAGDIKDGKFVLKGSVEKQAPAILSYSRRGQVLMFIENAAFTANIATANPIANKVTGTPTQDLLNQFSSIKQNIYKQRATLIQEYQAANKENDQEKMAQIQQKFDKMVKEAEEQENSLLKANNNTLLVSYLIASQMGGLEYGDLKAKYDGLGEQAKANEFGKKIKERMDRMAAVEVGQVAPDFTLNTPEGEPKSMYSIQGKVKIIDFWASWCGPCRGENPNVTRIYADYHDKGLEILGVSLDNDKEEWKKAIAADKLVWNHVSDLKGWKSAAAQLYCVSGIPHMIILDENNRIIAKDLRGDALRAKIAELLK